MIGLPFQKVLDVAVAASGEAKKPKILLFGDSHSYAVQRAIEKRVGKGYPVPLAAYRLLKIKNNREQGDTRFEDFLQMIGSLRPSDVVLSMIGGNQHAVFSTIQHKRRFDFIEPGSVLPLENGAELIPYRTITSVFERGIRKGDGKSLEAIRAATSARVVHIVPPPPKADNDFIQQHHETLFAREGIAENGVSSPQLRMKFWRLQTRVLEALCGELAIEVMLPPTVAQDAEGFLGRDYYGKDATHANHRYGEQVLRQVQIGILNQLPKKRRAAA